MSFHRRIVIPKFAGINRLSPPHLIDDSQAQVLQDAYLHRDRLEARLYRLDWGPPKGTTWTTPIRFFAKLHDGNNILDIVATNGNIYRDYSSVASGLDEKASWSGFIHGGSIYLASEDKMRVISSSTCTNWGIAKPTAACNSAQGAAGNLNGEYQYKITYKNASSIESDASDASTALTVSAKKIDLSSIPVSPDSQVTARNIYRIGGLISKYTLIHTISDNTTTTYTDNNADSSVWNQTVLDVSSHDEPASMPIAVVHDGRAYYAGHPDHPNRLYYSDSLYPEYSGNYRTIGTYEALVSLCMWESELFMYKQGEIWSLQGSVPSTAKIRPLQVKRGTVAPNSVAVGKFPTHIYWDGIYTHDGYVEQPAGRYLYDLFKSDVNTDALHKAVAVATRQFYVCSVPEKGYDENSLVIQYNYETRDALVLDFGATALYASEAGHIYAGTAAGKIYRLDHTKNAFDEELNFRWKSKKFMLGETPGARGAMKNIVIPADTSGQNVELFCYVDGARFGCGIFSSNGLDIHDLPLGDRGGLFGEIELKYTGQERPTIYTPIIINPEGQS